MSENKPTERIVSTISRKLSTKEYEQDIVSDYQNILTMALRTDDPEKLIGMFLGSILFLTEFHIDSDGPGISLTKKGILEKDEDDNDKPDVYNGTCEGCGMGFIRCTFELCPDCKSPIIPEEEEGQ